MERYVHYFYEPSQEKRSHCCIYYGKAWISLCTCTVYSGHFLSTYRINRYMYSPVGVRMVYMYPSAVTFGGLALLSMEFGSKVLVSLE